MEKVDKGNLRYEMSGFKPHGKIRGSLKKPQMISCKHIHSLFSADDVHQNIHNGRGRQNYCTNTIMN